MNKKELFRKTSMESISSPEQLTDYLKVTNPSAWIILAAVAIVLIGGLVWLCVGTVETDIKVNALAENGRVSVSIPAVHTSKINDDMIIKIAGSEISDYTVREDKNGSKSLMITADVPDGEYDVTIVTERLTPISFLIN